MAETLHQYKSNGLPKAPFEEVEGSSIDDDCSIRTAQISNVRRVTVRFVSWNFCSIFPDVINLVF